MSQPMSERTGVIHDLGYRGYAGQRVSTASLVRHLFLTGLRHAYGLGRSGRSKVLPFLLLAFSVLPAVIMVGVVTVVGLDDIPISYAAYASQLQMLTSLFAAAQAPVLFSRDLRHRSIVLYLARPLSAALFAITRWASLAVAILAFMLIPALVLYVGGLLAGLDVGEQTPDFLKALALQVLLAALLATITGLLASVALRRGFAVVASIIVLIVVVGVVLIIQSVADFERISAVGEIAGLLSPWTIHNALAESWDAGSAIGDLEGVWPWIYVATPVAIVAAGLALLVARFTKVGAR